MITRIQRLAVVAASCLALSFPILANDIPNPATISTETTATAAKAIAIEGLPTDAPREGTLVTVDLTTNTAYLFRDGDLVAKSLVGTGSDKVLRKGKKTWWFRTPRGLHSVVRRIPNPIWTKPDWAFIEEGKAVPPPNSKKRQVKGKLGKYALDLGDGILLHGTDDPNSFGRKVSHGCIRVPEEMLSTLWQHAAIGTTVYIYESSPDLSIAESKGLNDLDFKLK
ncbi:MAG TPA: L,D-transpeptidase [Thermoanaerobaculia bacterium]